MLSHLTKTAMLAAGLLIAGSLSSKAQDTASVKPFAPNSSFRTWSVGVGAGATSNYTIFHGKDDWANQDADLGYSIYVKKQILHSWGIQATAFGGKLHGSKNNNLASTDTRYNTTIDYAGDISSYFNVANINWGHKNFVIQPYATVGGGFMAYKPTSYNAAGAKTAFNGTKEIVDLYIPVGIGVKFNITSGINLDFGYQVNFVNNDNIDANITGSTFDRFSYSHIGLEFAIGKSSKPQLATHNPVAAMRAEYTAKEAALQNKIDAQKAVTDKLKADVAAANANTAATNATIAKLTADSDGDGVPDAYDKCPNTPAGTKVDGSGCPLPEVKSGTTTVYVTEADRKVVKEAIDNLEFDFGKATLRPGSFPSLNKVAELLISKNFSLKLAGHTDNVGSDAGNMKLSKNRAEAIRAYLVTRGANASRIEAVGYGKTQPIASNATEEGRQQNRRVEFTLY